jgi:heme/copper-type cytochrome/quinol oxidase subunit 2
MEAPKLIENNIRFNIFNTLRMCHDTRSNIYVFIWNLSIFLIFITVFGFALYLCAKYKKSNVENRDKFIKDQKYILDKIRAMKELESPITKLPTHSSGYSY